ncbi:MAG: hypothetical protein HYR86_06450, partial [Candidatus Rokubacteria bacterium]|nr:hypothetical protein [Candidatus Rokubacteria bacterium]
MLSFTTGLFAQQYSFHYYGTERGLTNLAVKSMFQDRAGFLWLGTENGIFRFDGDRFQPYGEREGMPDNIGPSFGEAPDGTLLVGSTEGLFRLVADRFERVPMPGATLVKPYAGISNDGAGHTYLVTDRGPLVLTISGPERTWYVNAVPVPAAVTASISSVFARKDVV